ncbi:hypothetical protein P154DRAFT_518486 [Amniculicola lignicola CBS 123094]|uniref:Uncharacterized protein n=1 Tax=Amniculicola lignicola CBS 123094 TaxID=1392246 RepID=A0A6A5X001_9PLEO|nr:hypothetical protein P154DRAFT_518486 [Amniculicola lignicola CBS 123094]
MSTSTAEPAPQPFITTTSPSPSSTKHYAETQGQPLPLPSPAEGSTSTKLNVGGEGVKLDHLGPMVVNRDGTLSRIGNWEGMTEIERANTVRVLGKRNMLRLGKLRAEEEEGSEETKT